MSHLGGERGTGEQRGWAGELGSHLGGEGNWRRRKARSQEEGKRREERLVLVNFPSKY